MKQIKYVIVLITLFFAFSAALGAAWTTKRLTNNAGYSFHPTIATSGEYVYVVWDDDSGGNTEIYFRRSLDNGATWQVAKRLAYNAGNSINPRIAAYQANIYIVWYDDSTGNNEIYFRRSTDHGATWQSTKRITYNAGISEYPRIAAYQNNVYIVWEDDTPGNDEVYFRRSADGGATWQTAKRLTVNSNYSGMPDIAADGSNIYALYVDTAPGNSELYIKRSMDSGATWLAAQRLTNNSGFSMAQHIAAKGTNVYIAWSDNSSGNSEVFFRKSTDYGATWQNAKRLTSNSGVSDCPVIAVSGVKIFVAWMDDTAGNYEVYFKKSANNGSTWQDYENLTNNKGAAYHPAIAVNSTNIYVTWDDDYQTPGVSDIYLKYSPL